MNSFTKRLLSFVLVLIFALSAAACAESNACTSCGKAMGDSDKYCPHCGSEQVVPSFTCSKCGRENAAGSKFCGSCGEPLAGASNTTESSSGGEHSHSSDFSEDTYDPAGDKVLLISSGAPNSWNYKYYYDYNGNEIRSESYIGSKKGSVVESFYDEHGNLKKKVTQDYDDNEYTEITYTNTYDENGNLLKSVSSYDGSYDEYIYNSDGLLETKVIYGTNYYTKEPYKYKYIKYFYDDGVLVETEEGYYGDNDEMTPMEIFQNGRLTYQVYGDGTNYLYEYIYTENSTDVKVIVHTEYESHEYDLKNCNCDKNSLENDTAKCDKYGNLFTSGGAVEGEYMTLAEYRQKGLYSEQGNSSGNGSGAKCLECNQAGHRSCIGHPCDQCGGDGYIPCSGCKGSGVMAYSPLDNNRCFMCGGDKTEICPNNHCKAGKIFYN